MVKIRLQRVGATKRPFYRIVALDERRKRNGRALEFLGTYDPKGSPAQFAVKTDRVEHWIGRGAQMSESVASLVREAKKTAGVGAA